MLQAMNTGHDGSLTTIHSNSPRDTLSRIETMTLMAGFDLPMRVIREQMSSAIDLIVHLTRLRDGTRRVTHVSEVQHMEGDVIIMQDLFMFDFSMGMDERREVPGHAQVDGDPAPVRRQARGRRRAARRRAVRGRGVRPHAGGTAMKFLDRPPGAPRRRAPGLGHHQRVSTCETAAAAARSPGARTRWAARANRTPAQPASDRGRPELVETPVPPAGRRRRRRGGAAPGRAGQIVKRLLDQADLPVRPAEALFVYLVVAVVGGALGLLGRATSSGVSSPSPPWPFVPWAASSAAWPSAARAAFTAQLPDMLQLLGHHAALGVLDPAGPRHRGPAAVGPHRQGDAPRGGRGPPGAALVERPRRGGPAGAQRRLRVGGHRHRDPARGRGQPGRAPRHRGRDHDRPGRIRREAHTLTAEGRIGAVGDLDPARRHRPLRLRREPELHQPPVPPGVRGDHVLRLHRARPSPASCGCASS